VTNLFYFLWKQKASGGSHRAVADLCVPSTVVLEHNFPKAWYYNVEGDAHDLERKLGRDVDTHLILKDFRDSAVASAPGDIVAAYYATVDADRDPGTRVEFLDDEQLQEFLLRRTRRPDGFLQKWVNCSSKYNTVIQAVWSPHMCVVRKRQNRFAMRDKRQSMFDRAVTYEGPTHLSDEVFVAPHVQHQIEEICNSLVHCLFVTQRVAIQRVVLHFKVDSASNIWLLYCSSLRVANRTQLNLAPRYVRHTLDETSLAEAANRRLTASLRDEAYERGGSAESPRATAGRSQHPLVLLHPKPPTMGPIGDMYDETPLWTARAKQLSKLKHSTASPRSKKPSQPPPATSRGARQGPLVLPSPKPPVPSVEPTRRRRPKRSHAATARPSSSSAPLDAFARDFAALRENTDDASGAPPRTPCQRAKRRWAVLRIAVYCRLIREVAEHSRLEDWSSSFLYALYSHVTCSNSPVTLSVPPLVQALLPADWSGRLSLSVIPPSPDDREHLTVLACGQPLVRLQSGMRMLVASALSDRTKRKQRAVAALLRHIRVAAL